MTARLSPPNLGGSNQVSSGDETSIINGEKIVRKTYNDNIKGLNKWDILDD